MASAVAQNFNLDKDMNATRDMASPRCLRLQTENSNEIEQGRHIAMHMNNMQRATKYLNHLEHHLVLEYYTRVNHSSSELSNTSYHFLQLSECQSGSMLNF